MTTCQHHPQPLSILRTARQGNPATEPALADKEHLRAVWSRPGQEYGHMPLRHRHQG